MYLVAFIVLNLSVFWVDIVECYAKPDLRDTLNTKWQHSYDFDGDEKADDVHVYFSGGAHCCYRIGISLSSQNRRVEFPFEMEGGYVGGLNLSNPSNFFISDFDNDGSPEIYMHHSRYNEEEYPVPEEWRRKYGFKSHKIMIDFRDGNLVVSDFEGASTKQVPIIRQSVNSSKAVQRSQHGFIASTDRRKS